MTGTVIKRGINSYRLMVSAGFDGNKKRQRLTRTVKASSPKEAEKLLAAFIVDIEKGNSAQSKGMTVADLWIYWNENYAMQNLELTSIVFYANKWPRIRQALGNIRLDRLEPKHVQCFYKSSKQNPMQKKARRSCKKLLALPPFDSITPFCLHCSVVPSNGAS